MEQLIISGPVKLKGTVKISGSKNAALPIIAASAIIRGKITIKNIPQIKDVLALVEILKDLGAKATLSDNVLVVDNTSLESRDPNREMVRHLRASILFIAPLLVRNRKINLPHPGGCLIGARPIDFTLDAFSKLGATAKKNKDGYSFSAENMKGADICAEFSVTATENVITAAVLTPGTTRICMAATEPHVQDLCNFLIKAGAHIEGVGTHNLAIMGVKELKPIDYEIIPDQIEAGTFVVAAIATKGEVTVDGFVPHHHESFLAKLEKSGVNFELGKNKITILPTLQLKPFKIRTEIYPGFPTDLQAPMAVLATQADGTSEIYETIFEGRLGYINELSKMGASCVTRDAHQATITGPTPLFGARITSFDLRAGATLVIAALIAQGESRLDQIEIIDRGYENIEGKLKSLGANIRRVKLQEIE
jgi:UDP-N-acetylglucosamine 1-carboxyvinyltransferase